VTTERLCSKFKNVSKNAVKPPLLVALPTHPLLEETSHINKYRLCLKFVEYMEDNRIRLLLLGDSGVGKTCLLHLLCNCSVMKKNPPWTIGCNFDVLVFVSSIEE
jgi:GTPase SAR1 family protein